MATKSNRPEMATKSNRRRARDARHHPYRGQLRGFGYFKWTGPGFITGAADDDPAGIATYSQVGALFRFDLVWTAPICLPLASAVQETAGRLGLAGRKGLIALVNDRFARPIVFGAVTLIVAANAFNIGADLGSMAEAFRLLVPIPFVLVVIAMAAVITALEVFVPYERYSKILRWLALSIFAYVVELFVIEVDWSNVVASFVPSFSPDAQHVEALVAIFGTTISPYLFLWQAGEEVEERKAGRVRGIGKPQIKAMRVDVVSGMSAGVIVMFAIMVAAGSTLGAEGTTRIESAAQAANALEPIAGRFASLLFAAGIVGTGLLAIPTLAGSAAYAISEAFGWNEGLGRKLRNAPAFYGVIAASMLVGMIFNFLGVEPIQALYISAILNGIAAPPLILLMLILSNSSAVGRQRGGPVSNALVGTAFVAMAGSAVWYLIGLL